MDFEAFNFTQVPQQPSVHIRDSNHTHCPHPLSNKLAIVRSTK